ncbi:unnamed protein product [Alopecurus aequalis]
MCGRARAVSRKPSSIQEDRGKSGLDLCDAMAKPTRDTPGRILAVVCLLLPVLVRAQLQVGFYQTTCPNAETLVRQAVTAAFAQDAGIAAGLIRLHFHDCFVRGCDASVLLASIPGSLIKAERDAIPNNPSLRGFDVIDAAKASLERSCPSTVSCADIVAFAARDSITLTGNVFYPVPAGRRDGSVSVEKDALDNLPGPTFTAQELIDRFKNKTLNAEEMVLLSGAHTVGRSFCASFADRIWNGATPIEDPGLSPSYAAMLRKLCPTNTTLATTAMDPGSPNVLDNNYYKLLPRNMGLFFSDNQLRVDGNLNALVNSFAANETMWKERFAAAMVKMGRIEVQTGRCGQVRLNCSVVNPTSALSSPVDEEGAVATS